MTNDGWNPWKLTAIGMALVLITAVVTGLVVANWTEMRVDQTSAGLSKPEVAQAPARAATPRRVAGVPPRSVIDACNQQATVQTGSHDKTMEAVKDAVVGGAVGAGVGAAGGAIAGGGKGAGKGAAIGGIVGAGAGTLYGLNENRKHDERYREAYASCMHARGYTA